MQDEAYRVPLEDVAPVPQQKQLTYFSTNQMPVVLKDRIRVLAAMHHTTMTRVWIKALKVGLAELERQLDNDDR